ncbi:MAG TPA: SPFH domain-containing protein [Anaerolineae bacterium]|nr:SPFH domain-containing protein [Anaerolineae bacterium]
MENRRTQKRQAAYDTDPPLAYRLSRALGRPLGLRWVGDNQLAIIYQMEQYHAAKGPGFFWINPFTQTVQATISIAPDFISNPIPNIQTRDALQLGLSIALAYTFDPRRVPRERAAQFVKWPLEVRRAIVTDNSQRALQAIVPQFYAEQICRGQVFAQLEQEFISTLSQRLQMLGLEPIFAMVLKVVVPDALKNRFEAIVQRSINVDDISHYEHYELTQAMRTEMIETLRHMGGGKQYIDLPDLKEMAPPQGTGRPQPRRITPPAPPAPEEPPADTKPKRPKSRL